MKTIYKYSLPINNNGFSNISMPINAKIIHCNVENNTIFIWAEVDTNAIMENVVFRIIKTGEDIGTFNNLTHIGSVSINRQITHIYKIG